MPEAACGLEGVAVLLTLQPSSESPSPTGKAGGRAGPTRTGTLRGGREQPPTLKVVEAAAAAALPSLTLSLGTRRQAQSRPAVYRTPEPSGRPHSWGAMRDLAPEGAETAVQPRTTLGGG